VASVFAYLDGQVKMGLSTMADTTDMAEALIVDQLALARPLPAKGQTRYQTYRIRQSITGNATVPADTQVLKVCEYRQILNHSASARLYSISSKMYCWERIAPLAKRLVDQDLRTAIGQAFALVKPGATLG